MERNELKKRAYTDSISITHRHILSVINTLLLNETVFKEQSVIRILDAGCGNGVLLAYLHKYLPLFNPGKTFLLYGYDVVDHGVQHETYTKKTLEYLHDEDSAIEWHERIKFIKSEENWPFNSEMFQFVVSNQVLEHVWDHEHFFAENNRVISNKGFAVHLFPVKEVIIDGHVHMPRVHQMRNWDAVYRKIKFYSMLGLGRYKQERKSEGYSLEQFSKIYADKIYFFCNYPSYKEFAKAIKSNGLCLTTRYNTKFYIRKIKELLGIKTDFIYRSSYSSYLAFYILKYVASISFVLIKGHYSQYGDKK